jgi:hypothetical protein
MNNNHDRKMNDRKILLRYHTREKDLYSIHFSANQLFII